MTWAAHAAHLVILLLFLLIAVLLIAILILFVILIIILVLIAIEVHHGILLILILGDEIAHILIRLLELHLVHALALIPMQERLPLIHLRELRRNALEHALNRRRIGHERAAHLRALRRNSDDARLDVVRDPRHEVILHLGLDLGDLVIHLLRGDVAAVSARRRQIFAILALYVRQEIARRPHLIRDFLHRQLHFAALIGREQRRLREQEKVQARERHQIH